MSFNDGKVYNDVTKPIGIKEILGYAIGESGLNFYWIIFLSIASSRSQKSESKLTIPPGNHEWSRARVSYSEIDSLEKDFIYLRDNGGIFY